MTALAVPAVPSPIPGPVSSSQAEVINGQTRRTMVATSSSPRSEVPIERIGPVKRRNLGEWNLEKTIGAGSMGKVKLARHHLTGEQVGR